MAKKLRNGLVEPKSIEDIDLIPYMQTTYSGYMVEIRERFESLDYIFQMPIRNSGRLSYQFIDVEFLALQIRMIMELMSYAAFTFEQSLTEPTKVKNRNKYQPKEVFKLMTENHSWYDSIDPETTIEQIKTGTVRKVETRFSSAQSIVDLYGKIGNLLHAQQRPRTDGAGRLDLDELLKIVRQLKATVTKHLICRSGKECWFVDITKPSGGLGVTMMNVQC